jgi:hypothetical protein
MALWYFIFLGTKALQDAGLTYDKIQQACCGYVYGKHFCHCWLILMMCIIVQLYKLFS